MHRVVVVVLAISTYAVGQATVSITAACTPTTSCTTTSVEANSFTAIGTSSGGVSMTSGTAAPSIPGVGIPPSTITLFAPTTVQTPYAVALYPTTAASTPPSSGFWYGTIGAAVTFNAVPCCSGSGAITGAPTINTGGASGYATAPPCYFANGGTVSTTVPATCYFTVSGGAITGVNISSYGSGYTSAPLTYAAPTLDLSYIGASDPTFGSSVLVQTSSGTLNGGHLASFNSSGDAVDSNIPVSGTIAVTSGNYLRANGTYFTSSAIQAGDVSLTGLAMQTANTVVGNGTASSASPTALTMPGCSAAADALIWTTSTGFGCNTAVSASTLGGATFASPGAIGGTTPAAGSFTGLTVTTGGTTTYDGSSSGSQTVGCTNATCTGITVSGVLTFANLAGSAAGSHIKTFSANHDISGTCTSASGTTCTPPTFATSYTATPSCVVTATASVSAYYISTQSNTGFTITYTPSGAASFNYLCVGNPA